LLPELVTETPEAYEAVATELLHTLKNLQQSGADWGATVGMKHYLMRSDSRGMSKRRTFEMHHRYQAGKRPDHIHVKQQAAA
jgi:hypothetical protein